MGLWSLLQEEKTSTKLHVSGNIDIKNDVVVSIEKGMHISIWFNTSTYYWKQLWKQIISFYLMK